jgi:preprotein translocase subunit SecB
LTGDWQPMLAVNLQTKVAKFEDKIYEVILIVTVTAKINDKIAFLVEVQQAGIFAVQGFEPAELEQMLNSYCPNILFPYAREFISDIVVRGGFPVLYLTPVNFDILYQQHLEKKMANQTDVSVAGVEKK